MAKICICFECNGSDEITCVSGDVKDPNEVFPKFLRSSPYYERVAHQESFGPSSKVSFFKHYISLIVHKPDENEDCIPCSDTLLGRMACQILMVDLISGKETELTLSESSEATMNGILMTRKELCTLWPDYFFIINQEWAILSLKKHWHFWYNSWFALLLVQIDPKTGSLKPKDSLVYWNDLSNKGYFAHAWQNVNSNSINTPLCGFAVTNLVHGSPIFKQIMLILFVSVNLRNRKLKVLKKVPDGVINWPELYASALASHKICMFDVEHGDPIEESNAMFMNFHQMKIYNFDETKKGVQRKQLTLSNGYEHEFVRRSSAASSEIINIDWSSEHVTLCLAAKPPFYNVANTFILDLPTFTWQKLQIPNTEATFCSNLQHHFAAFYRFQLFSDQVLIIRSSHVQFDQNANRSIINRWYRAHVRRPSSLLELTWIRIIRSNQLENNNLKTLESLL